MSDKVTARIPKRYRKGRGGTGRTWTITIRKTDGPTVWCHDLCRFWDEDACFLDLDEQGMPGSDCPGPGRYRLARAEEER